MTKQAVKFTVVILLSSACVLALAYRIHTADPALPILLTLFLGFFGLTFAFTYAYLTIAMARFILAGIWHACE